MNNWVWVCVALTLGTAKASAADECALPQLDAFGWQNAPCAQSSTSNRALWSGLISHVANHQEWQDNWQQPDKAESINIIAGQKTLLAGQDRAMTIALLEDAHGNAALDDSLVRFQATLAGDVSEDTTSSKNGLAAWIFRASIRAETGYATAQTSGHQSKRSDFHIVPNQITKIALREPATPLLPANGQIELLAATITDRYGNAMEDGALIRFQADEESGLKHFSQGLVANGAASAFPISGTKPISTFWRAVIGEAESDAIELRTEPQILAPQAELIITPELITRTLQLRAGPFTTSSGHRVVDGTAIEFTLAQNAADKITADRVTAPGRMVDGWAEITLPLLNGTNSTTISAALLGVEFTISIANLNQANTVIMTREIELELRGAIS